MDQSNPVDKYLFKVNSKDTRVVILKLNKYLLTGRACLTHFNLVLRSIQKPALCFARKTNDGFPYETQQCAGMGYNRDIHIHSETHINQQQAVNTTFQSVINQWQKGILIHFHFQSLKRWLQISLTLLMFSMIISCLTFTTEIAIIQKPVH